MLRALYAALVRLHPPAFQQRYGAEMLSIFDHSPGANRAALVTDATVSLLRQWLLRPEFHEPDTSAPKHALSMNPASGDGSQERRFLTAYFDSVRVLRALDLNHDFVISADEIANAPRALQSLDRNHDGWLDADECGAHLPGPCVAADFMRFHPVLAALDTNHDGLISAFEIASAPLALRALLDRNLDGELPAGELLPPGAQSASYRALRPETEEPMNQRIATLVAIPLLAASATRAQSKPEPRFEVASIKRDVSGEPGGMFTCVPNCHLERMTLKDLLIFAYRVHDFQVTGGPGWIDSDRYNIDAKAEGAASFNQAFVTLQYRRLQTLLRDRFNLTIHRETKELPVYELTVAKGGPKLQQPNCLQREAGDFTIAPGKYCGLMGGSMASGRLQASGASLANLANFLSSMLRRTVVDKTGISGEFDFQLAFTPDAPAVPSPDLSPDLFTAMQEQLGLKLESAKGPVEILIVDHVERPSEN